MTKTKQGKHITHTRRWSVQIDKDHMAYLCTPMKQGTPRLAAYMNLLASVAETSTLFHPPYGQPFYLEEGQVVISITDLSDRWKWARETVRKFLDKLAEFKLLTKEQLDRCSLITMKMTWEDDITLRGIIDSSTRFSLPQSVCDDIAEWICEEIDDSNLLKTIEETLILAELNECGPLPHVETAIQYEMIRQLVRISHPQEPILPTEMDSYSSELISRIFTDSFSGKWEGWLPFIRDIKNRSLLYLGESGLSDALSSYNNCRDSFIPLLKHLNVVEGTQTL